MTDSLLEEFKKERKPIEKEANRNMLVAGATPLLVGLLTGGKGRALDIAAKGIVDQQNMQFEKEKSLMDFLKTREKSRSTASSGKPVKVWNEESKRWEWQRPSDAIGSEAPYRASTEEKLDLDARRGSQKLSRDKEKKDYFIEKDIEKSDVLGKTEKFIKSEVTDEQFIYDTKTKEKRPVFKRDSGELPPKQKREVKKAAAENRKDSEKRVELITGMDLAINGIGKGEFGDKIGVMSHIKKIESRISDKDRPFYTEPLALTEKAKEFLRRQEEGGLDPKVIAQAKQMLIDARVAAVKSAREARIGRIKSLSADRRIDPDEVERFFGPAPSILILTLLKKNQSVKTLRPYSGQNKIQKTQEQLRY
jgi:hypothetical protein